MNSQLVSVIIPSFGRPDLLERAVISSLNQTWENIEVIVVDDNGPNSNYQIATETILKNIADRRLKYVVLEKNSGASAARNFGAKIAQGSYLAFLDNDDEFLPRKIELQMQKIADETLKNKKIAACVSHFCYCRNNFIVETPTIPYWDSLLFNILTKKTRLLTGSTLLVSKEIFARLSGFDESFERHQDIEFLVRLLMLAEICFSPEVLVKIHIDDRSNVKRPRELFRIKKQFFSKFNGALSLLSEAQRREFFQLEYFELARVSIRFFELRNFLFFLKKSKPDFKDLIHFFLESFRKAKKSIF